jgi:hypothetical protein
MKNILRISIILIPLILIIGCEDELRYPEFQEGATMRIQLDPNYSSLNASDIPNARLQFSLFTVNKNIESVTLKAVYYNFATDSTYNQVELAKLTQSDFDNEGAIRDMKFTSQFLAQEFGLKNGINDIGGGDRFDITNITKLTDGRVFPDKILPGTQYETINIETGIINGATSSFSFGFTSYVACPVPTGFATGKYTVEQIAGPSDPFFGQPTRWKKEVVTLVAESPIERSFKGTYLTFDGRGFNFLLICGNVLVGATSSGLSCGGPALSWKSPSTPGTYNETDDSVIIIELLDNIDGGCGLPAGVPLTLKLTKVK